MDKGMDGIWALADALGGGSAKQETRTQATVTRIAEDGTIWVHLPGGVPETPINGAATASVQPGDSVQVLVGDGRATLVGNATSPAVGERKVTERIAPVAQSAERASVAASLAKRVAESAEGIATSARAVANAVSQHFWPDTDGVHVAEVTQDEWNDSTSSGYHSGANVLLNALGQLFRDGLNNLLALVGGKKYVDTVEIPSTQFEVYGWDVVPYTILSVVAVDSGGVEHDVTSWDYANEKLTVEVPQEQVGMTLRTTYRTSSALAIYDGLGNEDGNIVSSISGNRIVMGRTNDYHLTIDSDSLDMLDNDHLITTFNATHSEYGDEGGGYSGTSSKTFITLEPNPEYDEIDNWDGVSRGAGYIRAASGRDAETSTGTTTCENSIRLAASSDVINTDTGSILEASIGIYNSWTDGVYYSLDSSIGLAADRLYLSAIGGHGGVGIGMGYSMVEAIKGLNCQAPNDTETVIVGEDTHPSTERVFQLRSKVAYNGTSSVYGHELAFLMKTNGLGLYDYTNQATTWQLMLPSGTTNLNVTTGTVTRSSAASSIGSSALRKQGNVVSVILNDVKLASALASGSTSGTIATIPTGYRPGATARTCAVVSSTGNYGNVWGVVGTSGNVVISNRSSLSISTSVNVSFSLVYIVS